MLSADASVDSARSKVIWVRFSKKFIGVIGNETTITLDDWVAINAPGADDLILQMDIEGTEWSVLLNVSRATLLRFRILVIEFHDLERLMDKHAFTIIAIHLSDFSRTFMLFTFTLTITDEPCVAIRLPFLVCKKSPF